MKLLHPLRAIRQIFRRAVPLTLGGTPEQPLILAQDSQPLPEPIPLSLWIEKHGSQNSWDLQITLALHTVLCVPPMPGLKPAEFPAYWTSIVQRAFPDTLWHVSALHPYTDLQHPHLITALPQRVWHELQPLLPHCQWIRPLWSAVLHDETPAHQHELHLTIRTWWELDQVLWLESNEKGWTHARVRRIPSQEEERARWLEQALQRTPLEPQQQAQLYMYGLAPSYTEARLPSKQWRITKREGV